MARLARLIADRWHGGGHRYKHQYLITEDGLYLTTNADFRMVV